MTTMNTTRFLDGRHARWNRPATWALLAVSLVGLGSFESDGSVVAQTAATPPILLHSRVFVPPAGLSTDLRSRILGSGRSRWHVLVQTVRIPTAQEHAQLQILGLRLLVYIPNLAWIASVPVSPAALDGIARHPVIRSI